MSKCLSLTNSTSAFHNAIIEAGGKDHPSLLAPGKKIDADVEAEAKDVHIILNGINNDIYSTVDACPNANEMKFTFKDGESLESYYSRFYKMMNELVQNQCIIDNHHVNVQLLLLLKPEWQRSHAATQSKGKEIDKAPSPPSESDHKVFSDEEETPRDKEI
ncbi:hypothetical protein Tco_1264120 [Tanacetum coccineum]